MPQNLIDEKLLVKVMVWQKAINWTIVDLYLCCHTASLSHSVLTSYVEPLLTPLNPTDYQT